MARNHEPHVTCQVCQKSVGVRDAFPTEFVRAGLAELIHGQHPAFAPGGYICTADLNRFRTAYVQKAMEDERGELSQLDRDVIDSLHSHELVAQNLGALFERELTFGEQMSDRLAAFGGSWGFIGVFALVMAAWILANSLIVWWQPFDPYPFILLNLVLSCLAAIQAPIIMMSQNRQEAKDRRRGEYDYRVDLKAELEIRQLHAKLDMLLTHQWQRLLELQQIQTDLMQEIAAGRAKPPKG
jgi:uncharacterized membrane protein